MMLRKALIALAAVASIGVLAPEVAQPSPVTAAVVAEGVTSVAAAVLAAVVRRLSMVVVVSTVAASIAALVSVRLDWASASATGSMVRTAITAATVIRITMAITPTKAAATSCGVACKLPMAGASGGSRSAADPALSKRKTWL